MSETTTPLETAMAPDTFDVFSFIEATAYPTEEVSVYQDVKSAAELLKTNQERLDAEAGTEKFDSAELDAKIAELTEKIEKSKLTFELRGMPPGLVRELYTAAEDDEDAEKDAENKLIAGTIVAVRNATGARDAKVWDTEGVAKLRHFLKEGEFGKLIQGVVSVNFNATVFDQATDAGFLGGSPDVAP